MEMKLSTLLSRLKKLSWGKSLALLVLLSSVVTSYAAPTQPILNPYLQEIFTNNDGNINHVVVHRGTGNLYLGSVNGLHQLTENLTVVKSVSTGPQNDSPNCPRISLSEVAPIIGMYK